MWGSVSDGEAFCLHGDPGSFRATSRTSEVRMRRPKNGQRSIAASRSSLNIKSNDMPTTKANITHMNPSDHTIYFFSTSLSSCKAILVTLLEVDWPSLGLLQ